MKRIVRFIKTTLVGGVIFLLPVVLTIVLLRQAVGLVEKIVRPIAAQVPVEAVGGMRVASLIAIILLILVGFFAGLVASTRPGRRLQSMLEQLVLRKMPGYTLLKGATGEGTAEGTDEVEVALARFDDNTVLGYVMEKNADGTLTVFVPSAPTPAVGTVFYLPEDRITRLDVPVAEATKVIMRLGVGSKDLLGKRKAAAPPDRRPA